MPVTPLYLVTGGAGFVGSALATALLAEGVGVRILDDYSGSGGIVPDARCETIVASVGDAAVLHRAMLGVAGCFHLAGDASAVLAAAAPAAIPVVLASSASVYGPQPDAPIREDAALAPHGRYAADKLAAERAARHAFEATETPTLCLRFFNIYGPRRNIISPATSVVSHFLELLLAGRPLPLDGDGLQKRDFLYLDDAVAFLRAGMGWLERGRGHAVLNGCTGKAATIRDLAVLLGNLLGRAPAFICGPGRDDEIRWSCGDADAAFRVLGVAARVELSEGLRRSLQDLQVKLRDCAELHN